MFESIGKKIKGVAKFFAYLEIAIAIIAGLFWWGSLSKYGGSGVGFVIFIVIVVVASGIAFLTYCCLYGFGELIDLTRQIEENTKPCKSHETKTEIIADKKMFAPYITRVTKSNFVDKYVIYSVKLDKSGVGNIVIQNSNINALKFSLTYEDIWGEHHTISEVEALPLEGSDSVYEFSFDATVREKPKTMEVFVHKYIQNGVCYECTEHIIENPGLNDEETTSASVTYGLTAEEVYKEIFDSFDDPNEPINAYILNRLYAYVNKEKRFGTNKKDDLLKCYEDCEKKRPLIRKGPIIEGDGKVLCPCCGKTQDESRKLCFSCGVPFLF